MGNSHTIASKIEKEKIKAQYLTDSMVMNIYNDIKKERIVSTPTPTPIVENFENIKVIPLHEKINNDLKKKFNENFKF